MVLGCRLYNSDEKYRSKRSLILEGEKYGYQKALSDIASSDVKCHNNDPGELVTEVRSWFSELGCANLESGSSIWDDFNCFFTDFCADKMNKGFKEKDLDKMPVREFLAFIEDYMQPKSCWVEALA